VSTLPLLQDGVARARVSMLGPVSTACAILSFYGTHGFAQGLAGGRGELQDADPPKDAVRQEAKHASK
jgi:hypothetical protein